MAAASNLVRSFFIFFFFLAFFRRAGNYITAPSCNQCEERNRLRGWSRHNNTRLKKRKRKGMPLFFPLVCQWHWAPKLINFFWIDKLKFYHKKNKKRWNWQIREKSQSSVKMSDLQSFILSVWSSANERKYRSSGNEAIQSKERPTYNNNISSRVSKRTNHRCRKRAALFSDVWMRVSALRWRQKKKTFEDSAKMKPIDNYTQLHFERIVRDYSWKQHLFNSDDWLHQILYRPLCKEKIWSMFINENNKKTKQ